MDALLKQFERLQRPIDLVQTLHDSQLKEVPARYILPSDQRPSLALEAPQSIPVIDLAAHHSETVTQVAQASQDWGFFQIINHGIDLSLLERIKQVSKEFFDLPLEEKRRQCPVRPGTRMLEGYGRFFDISDDTVLDWVDALVHYVYPSSVKAVEHWPKTPLTYRETYEKYGEELLKLTNKLLGLLSEGLGLDPLYVQTLIKEPLLQLRINYYPPCPQPDLVHGVKPHSDGGVVAVLLDDQVEGLQVRKGREWFSVSPVPGSLVVNIGDLLQSGGPSWCVRTGRRDGVISRENEASDNIPLPFFNFSQLQTSFTSKGLNVEDLVVLTGAHTIGISFCPAFSNRLYNFTGKGDMDPSLDPTYAQFLKSKCTSLADITTTVAMDPDSSLTFDSHYFANLEVNKGLFQSDVALLTNPIAKMFVDEQMNTYNFFENFKNSMQRMSEIEVLTGKKGQIRHHCAFVN